MKINIILKLNKNYSIYFHHKNNLLKMNSFFKLTIIILTFVSCSKNDKITPIDNCVTENYFSEYNSKNFNMGFTTWSFGPNVEDVDDTYQFIKNNTDIYAEHIDSKIPWNAWIHNLTLPLEFTNEIDGRVSRRITNHKLLLSVSLLNAERSELAEDFDGTIPTYANLNDIKIENAYFKHIQYLVNQFSPNYLVIAIEVNELRLRTESKWGAYKLLIKNVKSRIKQLYPTLKISESISLHNLYEPPISNPTEYINEIVTYMNQMDFVSISFYPFLKNQHSDIEFQQTFDFLHNRINKPIAFVETSHIAENLSVQNLNLFIESNECEQNTYLETLLTNAQEHNYEFVIWWAYRDFDALWETFPPEVKDLGKLWRDTGLLDENGNKRLSFITWEYILNK